MNIISLAFDMFLRLTCFCLPLLFSGSSALSLCQKRKSNECSWAGNLDSLRDFKLLTLVCVCEYEWDESCELDGPLWRHNRKDLKTVKHIPPYFVSTRSPRVLFLSFVLGVFISANVDCYVFSGLARECGYWMKIRVRFMFLYWWCDCKVPTQTLLFHISVMLLATFIFIHVLGFFFNLSCIFCVKS